MDKSTISRIKALGTYEAIAADPQFKNILRNVYPLSGNLGQERTVKGRLGKGAFGRVNLEETEKGNVATKYVLDPTKTADNLTEVAVLKYLQGYPNVAQLIKLESKPAGLLVNAIAPPPEVAPLNFPAIVMGKASYSLDDVIKRNMIKSWSEMKDIIRQVIQGLYLLHSLGIAHRDIKPGNILMTATNEIWFTDFGKSKYMFGYSDKPMDGFRGTLKYTSPELSLARELEMVDEVMWMNSDCWALGVTLFNLLTGKNIVRPSDNSTADRLISIFRFTGKPKPTDGITYEMFEEYDDIHDLQITNTENKVRAFIFQNAIHKPDAAHQSELIFMANLVGALLKLNPVNRASAATAYFQPGIQENYANPLPDNIQPRNLMSQYMVNVQVNNITGDTFDKYYEDFLKNFIYGYFNFFKKGRVAFLLDRTGVYVNSFLNVYKNHPYCKEENLRAIIIVGFYISYALFFNLKEVFVNFQMIENILSQYNPPYEKPFTKEILNMYLTGDIQFLGKTFFDKVCDYIEVMTTEKLECLGFLNYSFFQFGINYLIKDYEGLVIPSIVKYVNETVGAPFISMKQTVGMAEQGQLIHPYVSGFYAKYLNTEQIPIIQTLEKATAEQAAAVVNNPLPNPHIPNELPPSTTNSTEGGKRRKTYKKKSKKSRKVRK